MYEGEIPLNMQENTPNKHARTLNNTWQNIVKYTKHVMHVVEGQGGPYMSMDVIHGCKWVRRP